MKRSGWLACVLGLAVGAAACNGNGDYGDGNTAQTDSGLTGSAGTSGDGTIRVADVVANPNEYLGKTVTIEADVEEVFGPRAFALDEDAPFAGGIDNDLLVLSKEAGSLADIDDQWLNNKVRVTGTVGRMSVIEVERELGWDLDPELEIELEGAGAVLIASSVNRVQDTGPQGQYQGTDGDLQARADLPATASWLPVAGIIGLLSMGGALGIRYLRRE
jgi:hypothetical protein